MSFRLLALPLLALLLLASACGGSDNSLKDAPTPPVRKAGVLPTIQVSTAVPTQIPEAFNGDALLMNVNALANALQRCSASVGNKDALKSCVDKEMVAARVNQPAIDFFRETGYWLIGFTEAGRIDMANVLATEPGAVPQIGILGPGRQLQVVADLFAAKYPQADTDHQSPFRGDPKFDALQSLAKSHPGQGGVVDLRHYDDAQFETALQMATAPKFIVEIGLSNGCRTCGTGVAARYTFSFDLRGNLTETTFQGLCQGRRVTKTLAGRMTTYHEFASVYGNASGGFDEPYLLTVPGLSECPAHLDF